MALIDTSKQEYYRDTLASATPAEAQKCVKDLLYSTERRSPSHGSEQELADRFIQFFSTKVANIRTALNEMQQQLSPVSDSPPTTCTVPVLDSFRLMTQRELLKLLRTSASNSCMLDPAPTSLVKHPAVLNCLLLHMMARINISVKPTIVPDCLKEAVVTPILKKQSLDTNLLKNYLIFLPLEK